MIAPNGDVAAHFDGPLHVDSVSSLAEVGEELTSVADGVLTFNAAGPGLYRVAVSVDGVPGAEFAVRVVVAAP